MTFTVEDIGNEITLTYPHGTTFTTTIVENTCAVCGKTYLGAMEEVAHLLAQHSIIHGGEAEQITMSIAHLDDDERAALFQSHLEGLRHMYEEHPSMRNKVLISLQICLARYASIHMMGIDEQ